MRVLAFTFHNNYGSDRQRLPVGNRQINKKGKKAPSTVTRYNARSHIFNDECDDRLRYRSVPKTMVVLYVRGPYTTNV